MRGRNYLLLYFCSFLLIKIVFDSKVKITILPCNNVVSNLRIDINELKSKLDNKSEFIVDGKEEHYIDKGVHIYQFKLNEDAYNLLNYSLKKYKKISNFS